MITALDLRHLITAAEELHLPLTVRQVDQLTHRAAAHAERATRRRTPRLVLSREQLDVLAGLAAGEQEPDIARRLNLTGYAVKGRRERLFKVLGAKNAPHAVALAYGMGLLRTARPEATGRPGGEAR